MKGWLIFFAVLLGTTMSSQGQELNCTVEINTDQVGNTGSADVFQTLQEAISEYMNTTQFTNAQFTASEKIECRLFLTVKEYTDDKVTGDLQIQSTRPVYNASYTTTLLNFKDSKIDFEYRQGEPLIFTMSNMESQLTAILNFYAYLVLAMDFDSFSPQGGEPWYDRLKIIVQQAQSSGEVGWRAFEDTKNRSAVLAALTDPATSGLRQLLYDYHRQGLDQMATSASKGRASITSSLDQLQKIFSVAPMSVGLSMFRDAKMDELVNVYSRAPQEERQKAYDLLQPIYPTDNDRLEKIKRGDEKQR